MLKLKRSKQADHQYGPLSRESHLETSDASVDYTTTTSPASIVTVWQFVGLCWRGEIDTSMLLLRAVLATSLILRQPGAKMEKEKLYLHWCPINLYIFHSLNIAPKYSFRFIQITQTLCLSPLTGKPHFLASRYLLFFCVLWSYSLWHLHQMAEVWSLTLTRPAMGVESLFTRLIIPGFNWLIKLWKQNV